MNFILPENIDYQCIQCGLCCQRNWIIGIDDTSYARLLELDWTNARPDLTSRQLFVTFLKPPSTGERYTFSRTKNGACIFLTKDNRCQIHASFDFETKAQVCKEFPYHFVETPDGVVVGLSFACTAVRESTGPSVVKNLEEIQQIYQNHYRKETIQEPIVLVSSMTLTWQEYKAIEQALFQILTDSAYSFETALIAGSIIINVAVGLKQVELQAQATQKIPQETLLGGLTKLQLEKYRHVFEIALKAKKVVNSHEVAAHYRHL